MLVAALVTLLATSSPCAPPGRVIVNEVLYDAAGDDSGWEFVELFNPGAFPVALAGARLESGDGSGPGRWTLRWTAGPADSVPAGGRFVIGGARVRPAPDAVITLDLQNGPDAVRLVWPDGAADVVGWGAHEFAEYACGAPASDVPGGQSLARLPDGADRGSNAIDLRAADPTPGRSNQSTRDLAVTRASLALQPERPAAGEVAALSATLVNRGLHGLLAGEGAVRLASDAWDEPILTTLGPLSPGDSVRFAANVQLPAGAWEIELLARLAGDEAAANDADTLRVGAGPPPVEVSEIQFHPSDGTGEWLELHNASPAPIALTGAVVSDRGGTRARLSTAPMLPPDSLLLLAQDRPALLARRPTLDSTRVLALVPWPSLNNADDSSGTADAVELRDAGGRLWERVAYSARGVPAGVPLERDQGVWRAAASVEGTPLAPPATPESVAGRFALSSSRARAGGETRARWDLPWPRASVQLVLHDLAGRRVRVLAPEGRVPGRGERTLSLAGVRAGLYVLTLMARSDDGIAWAASRALRVSGVEP